MENAFNQTDFRLQNRDGSGAAHRRVRHEFGRQTGPVPAQFRHLPEQRNKAFDVVHPSIRPISAGPLHHIPTDANSKYKLNICRVCAGPDRTDALAAMFVGAR